MVIPRLETLKKEGQAGQAKITQYTRYLTLALAVLQATGIVALARSRQLLQNCAEPLLYKEDSLQTMLVMVITMTAGTAVIMWLGELITDRGIGNGMSILIFTQVVATFPSALWQVKVSRGWWTFGLVMAIGLVLVAAVIFMEQGQRRIPVQYARRMVGRKMFGGSSTYIPLKVNQAGIIPVIFASSLLYLPALATQFDQDALARHPVHGQLPGRHRQPVLHGALLRHDHLLHLLLRRHHLQPARGGRQHEEVRRFHPRDPAGKPTEEYLKYVLDRITLPGSLYLGLISLVPLIALVLVNANQNFPFGGTSILIMVGVALDTVKQIESQLATRQN